MTLPALLAGHPASAPARLPASSFDDFVLAFFTSGVDPQPLPVRIYSAIRFGITPAINAVGTPCSSISLLARPARGAVRAR